MLCMIHMILVHQCERKKADHAFFLQPEARNCPRAVQLLAVRVHVLCPACTLIEAAVWLRRYESMGSR